MERTFYRIITPTGFTNIECETLDEANKKLLAFGGQSTYWIDQMKQCKIVKVTEITEDVGCNI